MHEISLAWSIPFALLLGCTALLPVFAHHFWEKFYPVIALGFGALTLGYYAFISPVFGPWVHSMEEYVSFIVLLGSLYIVSGGIYLGVKVHGSPWANSVLLLIGAVIANIFGTTGASMLLIRPYLRMNAGHTKPYHIVFFIFIVANVGGALTPIGDPPLFLGYLRGVPFWWVLEHCQPMWLLTVGILISLFFIIDTIDHRKIARTATQDHPEASAKILGAHNFLFIGLILYAVFQQGIWHLLAEAKAQNWSILSILHLFVSREILMVVAAVLSKVMTHSEPYHRNEFSYGAIREVAILFIGIFSTMTPALQWLQHNAEKMPVKTPGQYYYATGLLSAALDNAPTYLTFLQMELASIDREHVKEADEFLKAFAKDNELRIVDRVEHKDVRNALLAMVQYHRSKVFSGKYTQGELEVAFLVGNPELNPYLVAISLGAVFFGACTYIGNGPNFMVKNIAASHGVKTPSFIGYIVFYALPILLPTFTIVWWVFLRVP